MKKQQSYVVTFCNSGKGSSEPSSPLMERKQGSSTDLLIDPRQRQEDSHGRNNSHSQSQGRANINIVKMEKEALFDSSSGKDPATLSKLRDKFRGCLLGALVGDCIGTLFERDYSVSLTLLEDLYHSLTNLSEDEKLMDLHGIDSALGPKKIKEILETKRQSHASIISEAGSDEGDEEGGGGGTRALSMSSRMTHLSKPHEGMLPLRRNSALAIGTPSTIPGGGLGMGGGLSLRRGSFSRPIERYSDDTVMSKSVLYSLVKCKGLDTRHLAKQLTEDYFLNMNRKFGGYIRDIFVQLRENGYGDPYAPAKKYSGGIGAQGNEAASRVSPVALFCWNLNEHQIVAEMSSKQAKLTNAHRTSVHGTVLQAFAVHAAFNWELQRETCKECGGGGGGLGYDENATCSSSSSSRHGSPLLVRRRQSQFGARGLELPVQPRVLVEQQPKYFCEQILEKMNVVEGRGSTLFENLRQLVQNSVTGLNQPNKEKEFLKPAEPTYCDKLRTILEFLARSQPPTRIEVIERLGNGFKAMDSVPTAIYSFLFATKYEMLPEMSTQIKSPILRCIFHAISLGGETDTLASMAGAIAGAYWGYSQIPAEILRVCEGSTEILKLADELFNATINVKNVNHCPSCHR